MTTEHGQATDEATLRKLIEARSEAARAKNVNGLVSNHAPDILAFDVVEPLRYAGSDRVRERVQEWFSSYRGPIGYEIRDLSITTGDDVAFCHYLYRASGTRTDGAQVDMWVRATVCCRKIEGAWIVTHEHQSVPFDPKSGKASLDLEP